MDKYEYAEKLRSPKWQKKRLKIMERDGFKCRACGEDDKPLNVHHLVYAKGEPWDTPDDLLETLCETCHDFRTHWNELWGRSQVSTCNCWLFFCFYIDYFDGTIKNAPAMKWDELAKFMYNFHFPPSDNKAKSDAHGTAPRNSENGALQIKPHDQLTSSGRNGDGGEITDGKAESISLPTGSLRESGPPPVPDCPPVGIDRKDGGNPVSP